MNKNTVQNILIITFGLAIIIGALSLLNYIKNNGSGSGNSNHNEKVNEIVNETDSGSDVENVSKEDAVRDLSYQEKIQSVRDMELKEPLSFLVAQGTVRGPVLTNKIKLKCTIANSATAASFRDVALEVTYFNKSKDVITHKNYTVFEAFPPNTAREVNIKIESPPGTDSVGWKVVGARGF